VIAIIDLVAMLGIFFGLRPDRLADPRSAQGQAGREPLADGPGRRAASR
jgi:hypothetical protein